MSSYILRRLLLLPLTLFCILLVNFVILNLAPGDPVSITEISQDGGASRSASQALASGSDDRYLQFREFYGLTLPVLWNLWPSLSQEYVHNTIQALVQRELSVKEYNTLRVRFGDQARFIMPLLLEALEDKKQMEAFHQMALRFFIRGGTRQSILGPNLQPDEYAYNDRVTKQNLLLHTIAQLPQNEQAAAARAWYDYNESYENFAPTARQKIAIFFFDTRFFRYMSRVLTLDFGTMRNDTNKKVINEVTKRFKYSLTLSVTPLILTFFICQCFGFLMAYHHGRWPDLSLNFCFLILYAIPIFVVAPFLIQKIANTYHFPFSNVLIPASGFTSPENIYEQQISYQRLFDILQHIFLPIIAIMYGSLAVSSRLSRTAVLEVLRQDYVRTARAKGLSSSSILFKHVGRNAAITIVTSLAGSLGVVLGGSLIVETMFEINGFGKFFYEAILNRDYNVIMFSAIASSFLALTGYLIADITYTILDPRVTLE